MFGRTNIRPVKNGLNEIQARDTLTQCSLQKEHVNLDVTVVKPNIGGCMVYGPGERGGGGGGSYTSGSAGLLASVSASAVPYSRESEERI